MVELSIAPRFAVVFAHTALPCSAMEVAADG
jgi:hypothetical protein